MLNLAYSEELHIRKACLSIHRLQKTIGGWQRKIPKVGERCLQGISKNGHVEKGGIRTLSFIQGVFI